MDQLTVGSLFAGIGGFCRGFIRAGATVLWANELDKNACNVYRANFTHKLIEKDVRELSVKKDQLSQVDVLTAGFPCQPFSIAGARRGFDDERGALFFEIIRLIKEFGDQKPKILIFENVRNFRTHDNGRTYQKVKEEIKGAGYWFNDNNAQIMNTKSHTPIPHNRERIYMVACSQDHFPLNPFLFPPPLLFIRNSVRDYLELDKKADEVHYFKESSQYYPLFAEAIAKGSPDGVYQLRRTYVRENKSNSCFTLTASMGIGGHNVPVIKDDWGIRRLTPRECARLQGFNDEEFVLPDGIPNRQLYKQIGNAVSVPLIARLAEECRRVLATIPVKKSVRQAEAV